jgi:integral membrane protein (TIGR01906 family)
MRVYKLNWFEKFVCFLFPIAILLLFTWVLSGFTPLYAYQFTKNNISQVTGISVEDLKVVIAQLAGYVFGTVKELNHEVVIQGATRLIYNEKELLHMVDVRHIFDAIRVILAGYGLLLVVCMNRARLKGCMRPLLKRLSQFGFYGTLVIVLFLGLLVTLDFTKYFIMFHELFFTNDLWLLDPRTDVLIQMLPEVFFREFAIVILVLTLVFQALMYLVTYRYKTRF